MIYISCMQLLYITVACTFDRVRTRIEYYEATYRDIPSLRYILVRLYQYLLKTLFSLKPRLQLTTYKQHRCSALVRAFTYLAIATEI